MARLFENMVLGKISVPRTKVFIGEWRKCIKMIYFSRFYASNKIGEAWQGTWHSWKENVLWEKMEEIHQLEDTGLDVWIILKLILHKGGEWMRNWLIWLWIEKMAGCFEYENEPLGSIKCWEYLEWLRELNTNMLHGGPVRFSLSV